MTETLWYLLIIVAVLVFTFFARIAWKAGLFKALGEMTLALLKMGPVLILGSIALYFTLIPRANLDKAIEENKVAGNHNAVRFLQRFIPRYNRKGKF